MMLGINAPKTLVKGEYAKAVRKAVRDSIAAMEHQTKEQKLQQFNFEWRV